MAAVFAAGFASGDAFYGTRFEKTPQVADLTALGRELFKDPALSASGRMACATCHDPAHAFGAGGIRRGVRAVPSLRYLQGAPPFTLHFVDDDGNDSIDQGPAGGLTWDGRAASAHDQARIPLLSRDEMANAGEAQVVASVARGAEAARFRDTFGPHVFENTSLAFTGVLLALETYQQDPATFYPYSSRYDAWLRHDAALTQQEMRGLEAFADPARGNCARCHPSAPRRGSFPAFTDFGFAALGVPRNREIPATARPDWFDLGLCGPLRADLAGHTQYCGMFRTPSLRNVATRTTFMHNGVFHRLSDVVRFYAERDTRPQAWYPRAPDGTVLQFDDLPAPYRANVDRAPPFGASPGGRPALSERDVADIVAFLGTLTDAATATR